MNQNSHLDFILILGQRQHRLATQFSRRYKLPKSIIFILPCLNLNFTFTFFYFLLLTFFFFTFYFFLLIFTFYFFLSFTFYFLLFIFYFLLFTFHISLFAFHFSLTYLPTYLRTWVGARDTCVFKNMK